MGDQQMPGVSQAVASSDLVDLLLEGSRYADLEDVKQALAMGADVDCRDDQGRTGEGLARIRQASSCWALTQSAAQACIWQAPTAACQWCTSYSSLEQ